MNIEFVLFTIQYEALYVRKLNEIASLGKSWKSNKKSDYDGKTTYFRNHLFYLYW